MFSECKTLISLPDISNWNTENVTDMSNMFNECSSLITLSDISKWNTENVTNMSSMFSGLNHYHHCLIFQIGILIMLQI